MRAGIPILFTDLTPRMVKYLVKKTYPPVPLDYPLGLLGVGKYWSAKRNFWEASVVSWGEEFIYTQYLQPTPNDFKDYHFFLDVNIGYKKVFGKGRSIFKINYAPHILSRTYHIPVGGTRHVYWEWYYNLPLKYYGLTGFNIAYGIAF